MSSISTTALTTSEGQIGTVLLGTTITALSASVVTLPVAILLGAAWLGWGVFSCARAHTKRPRSP